MPETCPHPDCRASGCLIRWGTYQRWARLADEAYRILIQRIRCQACGRTHSLLPDFLHPYRQYVIGLLQHTVSLYLIAGQCWNRLMEQLPSPHLARSTVREWVDSFTYRASERLLDFLTPRLLALDPLTELPDSASPQHFNRILDPAKRHHLERAHRFWLLAEHLYAQVKARQPRLHFAAEQLFPFLLHWLQHQAVPARLF